MGLAGVWHGAGWQFVVFGLLHGALLVLNHAWRFTGRKLVGEFDPGPIGHAAAVLVTFLTVTVTLVFFTAASLEHALTVLRGMAGFGDRKSAGEGKSGSVGVECRGARIIKKKRERP